jgi:hypothetical protein
LACSRRRRDVRWLRMLNSQPVRLFPAQAGRTLGHRAGDAEGLPPGPHGECRHAPPVSHGDGRFAAFLSPTPNTSLSSRPRGSVWLVG